MSATTVSLGLDRDPRKLPILTRVAARVVRNVTSKNALPLAGVLVILAGIGDWITLAQAVFTLFYILPITIVTWFRGVRAAYPFIAACVATSLAVDLFANTHVPAWTLLVWNSVAELTLFLLFAHGVEALRARVDAETTLRRTALDQLRHAERLNTVGKLASGVAHELGTPLNVISGRAELICDGQIDLAGARKSARVITQQSARMTTIIQHLLAFARRGGTDTRSEDVLSLCRETAELIRPLARRSTVDISVSGDSTTVPMNRNEVQQVLTNLIANAIHAMPKGGEVELMVRSTRAALTENGDRAERPYAILEVRDHGTGIPPDIAPYIFDPFFTTKEVGEGTGLGLSIVYGIVRDHGGVIQVASSSNNGTTFSIFLPR